MKRKCSQTPPEPRAWQDVIAEGKGDPAQCLALLKREFPTINVGLWTEYLGLLHGRGLLPTAKQPRKVLWRCPRCGDKTEKQTPSCHPPLARVSVCRVCDAEVLYDNKHDALYCPRCNCWLDHACKDPSCGYCASRAAQPLAVSGKADS